MDGILGALIPLATLLSRTTDPSAASAALARVISQGTAADPGDTLESCFGDDATSALAALKTAGITGLDKTDSRIRLAQAEVLALEYQRSRRMAPCLAMTVPDFLRLAWAEHLREFPAADWPRETGRPSSTSPRWLKASCCSRRLS